MPVCHNNYSERTHKMCEQNEQLLILQQFIVALFRSIRN